MDGGGRRVADVRGERRSRRKGGERLEAAREAAEGAGGVPIRSDALFIARPASTCTLRLIFMESLSDGL